MAEGRHNKKCLSFCIGNIMEALWSTQGMLTLQVYVRISVFLLRMLLIWCHSVCITIPATICRLLNYNQLNKRDSHVIMLYISLSLLPSLCYHVFGKLTGIAMKPWHQWLADLMNVWVCVCMHQEEGESDWGRRSARHLWLADDRETINNYKYTTIMSL